MELTGKRYARNDWRRLLATRQGTVIVAVVCALVAAGILAIAMVRYRQSVDSTGNPETVFVASGLIQKGTSGDAITQGQLFKPTRIVAKQVTAGAIADASLLHGKRAIADIYPGQQLTAADFTTDGGLAAKLAPNQRALTITLDSAHGMVGNLTDGDHVDVYAGVEVDPGNGRTQPVLRLLMSNVPVLKAGSAPSGGIGSNPGSAQANVTLNVNDNQAGTLAYASDNGKIWLVLRPPNATSTVAPSSVTVQSLLFGGRVLSGSGR